MRKARAFYTVHPDTDGFPVSYLDPKTWKVRRLIGSFGDPGEASQEFQACIGGDTSSYLAPLQFQAKARSLAKLRRERRRSMLAQRV